MESLNYNRKSTLENQKLESIPVYKSIQTEDKKYKTQATSFCLVQTLGHRTM